MEYEPCHILRPEKDRTINVHRSLDKSSQDVNDSHFRSLLRGREDGSIDFARFRAFETTWLPLEAHLNGLLDHVNASTVAKLVTFIEEANQRRGQQIPTALLFSGPGNGVPQNLFKDAAERSDQSATNVVVTLRTEHGINLKSLCKSINHLAIQEIKSLRPSSTSLDFETRHLNFDFQLLHDYANRFSIASILLAFPDSETFDGSLLSDLIDVLSSWQNRLHFVLFFGISTSLPLFQARLTKQAVDELWGRQFDVKGIGVHDMVAASQNRRWIGLREYPKDQFVDQQRQLWLGPSLADSIAKNHAENIQSPQSFIRILKYIHMAHFFANPLSVYLSPHISEADIEHEHVTAIRHLPSFRTFCNQKFDAGDLSGTKELLENDECVKSAFLRSLSRLTETMRSLTSSVDFLDAIQSKLVKSTMPWSELYALTVSGHLRSSEFLRELLHTLQRLPYHQFTALLEAMLPFESALNFPFPLPQLHEKVKHAAEEYSPKEVEELRSGHDLQQSRVRANVVANRVQLQQHVPRLNELEETYTKIVDVVHDGLESYFENTLVDPRQIFGHEVLVYDLKSPYRDVFRARPRFSIERALRQPHDYLGDECCEDMGDALSYLQPTVSVVYNLLLECGNLVNTADLWTAFWTIMKPKYEEEQDDEEAARDTAFALFTRALAELKYMGYIKHSRKKQDHVAKLSWAGL